MPIESSDSVVSVYADAAWQPLACEELMLTRKPEGAAGLDFSSFSVLDCELLNRRKFLDSRSDESLISRHNEKMRHLCSECRSYRYYLINKQELVVSAVVQLELDRSNTRSSNQGWTFRLLHRRRELHEISMNLCRLEESIELFKSLILNPREKRRFVDLNVLRGSIEGVKLLFSSF